MSDDPRTTDQLRAEIAALKRQIEARAATAAPPAMTRATKRTGAAKRGSSPQSTGAMDRRAVLSMWLAPLLLAEPAMKASMKASRRWAKRFGRGNAV